jgi:ABC-type phosphate/phosphonate transport system substrate-binding protein
MSKLNIILALTVAVTVFIFESHTAIAGPHDLVVIRPGGATASDEAQQNVNNLLKLIARAAGWPSESANARYFNNENEGLHYIQATKPGFILTTPGFYLKYRTKLNLTPVNKISLAGSTTSSFSVVAKKGTLSSLADLKNKTVAGSSLSEPEFVQKIVFEGTLKLNADVKAKQMSGLPALKALRAGVVDAVVLDAQEYQSLPALPFASEFTTIFTSKPITNTGIMATGNNTDDASIKAMVEATKEFCATPDGKNVCTTFQITGFEPASERDYDELIKRWEK